MTYINPYNPFDSMPWWDRIDRQSWQIKKVTRTITPSQMDDLSLGTKVRYSTSDSGEHIVIATFDVPGISKENVVVSYDEEHCVISVQTSENVDDKTSSKKCLKTSVKPLVVSSLKAKCEHGRVTVTGTLVTAENKKTRHLVSVE